MKEIELKILNIDKEAITNKLIELGATKAPTVYVKEKVFDFSDHRLSNNYELLRVRTVGDKTEITYKKKSPDKSFLKCEEIETEVKDFDKICQIILSLGCFSITQDRDKKRTSFVKGNLKFEIDEFPDIPPYLEIEGPPEEIKEVVKLLGYSMDQTTNKISPEVIKSYGKDPSLLKF